MTLAGTPAERQNSANDATDASDAANSQQHKTQQAIQATDYYPVAHWTRKLPDPQEAQVHVHPFVPGANL